MVCNHLGVYLPGRIKTLEECWFLDLAGLEKHHIYVSYMVSDEKEDCFVYRYYSNSSRVYNII